MTTDTTVRIIDTGSETSLYRHYDSQDSKQPAYIELDLREECLLATYDAEIGNAVPFSVYHGFERRYGVPVLTGSAADRVMREIAPLADRILADWSSEWDGDNMVAVLGEDAQAAEAEIVEKLGCDLPYGEEDFSPDDIVQEWDVDGATNGYEADEYEITATTTDERLDEIEAEIVKGLAEAGDGPVVVVHGLIEHLRQLRDDSAVEDEG